MTLNIAFGICLILLTLGVGLWASLGRRLATIPIVAFFVGLLDGNHNVPMLYFGHDGEGSSRVLVRQRGHLVDLDSLPLSTVEREPKLGGIRGFFRGDFNLPTEAEIIAAPRIKPGLVVEEVTRTHPRLDVLAYFADLVGAEAVSEAWGGHIAASLTTVLPEVQETGVLAWLRGGYNIPTKAEVDWWAAARAALYPRVCIQRLRAPGLVRMTDGTVNLDIWNPMPEAQSPSEEAFQMGAASAVARSTGQTFIFRGQIIAGSSKEVA